MQNMFFNRFYSKSFHQRFHRKSHDQKRFKQKSLRSKQKILNNGRGGFHRLPPFETAARKRRGNNRFRQHELLLRRVIEAVAIGRTIEIPEIQVRERRLIKRIRRERCVRVGAAGNRGQLGRAGGSALQHQQPEGICEFEFNRIF